MYIHYYYCSGEEVDSIGKIIVNESANVDTQDNILLATILEEVSKGRLVLENCIKFNKRGSVGNKCNPISMVLFRMPLNEELKR